MDENKVVTKFNELKELLQSMKSDKRSENDRYIAIVITELEKAYAIFVTFVQ